MPPPTGYTPPPVAPEPGNPYAQQDHRYRRPDDNVSAHQPREPVPLLENIHERGGYRLLSAQNAYDDLNVSSANAVPAADGLRSLISQPIRNGYVPHYQASPVNPSHSPVNNIGAPPSTLPSPSPSSIKDDVTPSSPVAPDPIALPSVKSVQFDLNPQERSPDRRPASPTDKRERDRDEDGWEDSDEESQRSRHAKKESDRDRDQDTGKESKNRRRVRGRNASPDSVSSGETIELPPRSEEPGRRREIDEDPLAKLLTGLFR
jgi:hypothetical protein